MLKANNIFDVLGGLTLLAIVATVVGSKNVAAQLSAASKGYAAIMKAAKGS